MDESPLQALRLWGASDAVVAEWRRVLHAQARNDQEPEVWPEHWHAAQLFAAVGSQWRCTPSARGGVLWVGLDYAALSPLLLRAVRPTVPRRLRRRWPELFAQLQALEAAAIKARNPA